MLPLVLFILILTIVGIYSYIALNHWAIQPTPTQAVLLKVYAARQDVLQGMIITESMVELKEIPAESAIEAMFFAQEKDNLVGTIARRTIQKGTIITNLLVTGSPALINPLTPNPTQALLAAFSEIDRQFTDLTSGNIAFNRPEKLQREETTVIELILSPSLSESALSTQVVERGGLATSTAEPNTLIGASGEPNTIETSQVEITPRMKAVLKSQNPEAFTVTEMHDNAEQVVSFAETTAWRWSVTAKKEGAQTLELVIYQLVKFDEKEFWHEVETYKAEIAVEVTPLQQLQTWDWQWIASAILIPLIVALWGWWRNRNKKNEPVPIDSRTRERIKRNRN